MLQHLHTHRSGLHLQLNKGRELLTTLVEEFQTEDANDVKSKQWAP